MTEKKTYMFRWTEDHAYSVKAESLTEAIERFESVQEEGFGGKNTYVDSSDPHIALNELEGEQ